jgi:hypothetical protein
MVINSAVRVNALCVVGVNVRDALVNALHVPQIHEPADAVAGPLLRVHRESVAGIDWNVAEV